MIRAPWCEIVGNPVASRVHICTYRALPPTKTRMSAGSSDDVKFLDRRRSQNHAGLHSLFFAAGHRSHSSSEKKKVTPSQCEEASLRMVAARSERRSAANRLRFRAVFPIWNPRRGGRWGRRSLRGRWPHRPTGGDRTRRAKLAPWQALRRAT